jgi:GTP-binding protein
VDKVEILVRAGDGGNGAVSFRREKYVPFGGPDGGDGGAGGGVYIIADRSMADLKAFRHKRRFKAAEGKDGSKQKKTGDGGEDLIIIVPLGTMVFDGDAGDRETLLADLEQQGQKFLVAKGGRGGLGNVHFATSSNQAPKVATKGELGEERRLVLDLKLIADVGIIGYPNVGKSTFLAAVSKARPKIADYPFTTREPALGVVEVGMTTFVVAEIPGLIEGAHLGKGLGHDFLRHAERTKVLLHLLDGSSPSVFDNMSNLNTELALYNPELARKPQLVAVNKIDLPEVRDRLLEIEQQFRSAGKKVFFISAVNGQGVSELVAAVAEQLDMAGREEAQVEAPLPVFRPKPKARRSK